MPPKILIEGLLLLQAVVVMICSFSRVYSRFSFGGSIVVVTGSFTFICVVEEDTGFDKGRHFCGPGSLSKQSVCVYFLLVWAGPLNAFIIKSGVGAVWFPSLLRISLFLILYRGELYAASLVKSRGGFDWGEQMFTSVCGLSWGFLKENLELFYL